LIDPEVSPRPGDFVAAPIQTRGNLQKYRVRGIDEAGQEIFELVPLNDDYPVMRSDEHHLVVIGTMLEHRRKFRRRS
jgi:SOS-response transcriptional repressor LexA